MVTSQHAPSAKDCLCLFGDPSFHTEISRYMHAHLDSPISELNMDYDLTARFREGWIRVLNFPIESYVEQPGIGPDIRYSKFKTTSISCEMIEVA